MSSLETIQSEIAALRAEVKTLTKLIRKVKSTQEDPDGEKAKARAANNGFNRKQEVTPKLREFLGLAEGELISRSEVTKAINKYITEKGLKHPENGRQLILDEKLKDLLATTSGRHCHLLEPPKVPLSTLREEGLKK
jgi:chromatin remodeling complex protein RSC6